MRDLELLIPKWDVSITALLSRYKDLCKEGNRKIIRIRGGGQFQINIAFQTQWNWCTYDLTEAMTAAQDLYKLRPGKTPAQRRNRTKIPPLAREIFATDS